jgi:hypothetical protein
MAFYFRNSFFFLVSCIQPNSSQQLSKNRRIVAASCTECNSSKKQKLQKPTLNRDT